jgi:hypothetical protein
MSRRENESGFTNVGCRHQMWPTAHRQAKLSTIHPTLVRPQLPAVPAPRSQQTLLKILLFSFSFWICLLLGFSLAVPGLLLYLSHIAICRLVLVSISLISFYFSRIFLIGISSFALLLILILLFLCIYPFRFLDNPTGFGRISQPYPVYVPVTYFLWNISTP